MIEPHTPGSSETIYELGRLALVFGLIFLGVWIVAKLILRSGKRGLRDKDLGISRQQRRAERAHLKSKQQRARRRSQKN